jgi:hypothetical protein
MYSIIETAKENGLHPFRYVKYLLETLPGMTSGEVEDVMPWSGKLPDECRVAAKGEGNRDGEEEKGDQVHDGFRQGVS